MNSAVNPDQVQKAENFRNQHHSGKLLILPNIWDAAGARLMEVMGYPSVATASVSLSMSNGYPDGEKIPFSELMKIVKKITGHVAIPVTVDFEKGYAAGLTQLRENIHELIEQGAVGINLEDSEEGQKGLFSISEQCKKIDAVRQQANICGVHLFINARTDVFFLKKEEPLMEKAIERALAYKEAGADGIYPIMMNHYEDIRRFADAVQMPVNVNLQKPIPDLKKLEQIGVARVSVGPQLLFHVLSLMHQLAGELKEYNSDGFFSRELLARDFLNKLV